ncbi:hypothetical protein, partial [uncultured Marinobacter sp.]|uniref:hypothetical protein n=1 Tax=uncultured Marinobacter sp. TaxID=187379 RepID=UPI00259ACD01
CIDVWAEAAPENPELRSVLLAIVTRRLLPARPVLSFHRYRHSPRHCHVHKWNLEFNQLRNISKNKKKKRNLEFNKPNSRFQST